MPASKQRVLLFLAACVSLGGILSLFIKGMFLLSAAYSIWPSVFWVGLSGSIAILVGFLKGRLVMEPFYKKNVLRIHRLTNPKWWQFFSPWFLAGLLLMIVAGALLSGFAVGQFHWLCVVGALDISISFGLAISVRHMISPLIDVKQSQEK